MALDELLSICGHAYSLDLGRITCTQAHSRITDIDHRTPAVAGTVDLGMCVAVTNG